MSSGPRRLGTGKRGLGAPSSSAGRAGHGPRGAARRPSEEAILEGIVTSFLAAIKKEITGLAGLADPLEAEMVASGVLSMWHGDNPLERDARRDLGRAVIRRLSAGRDADHLAFLVALAATASPPLDVEAREAAERLREAKVPEPIWARAISRPALVDAWISTDELEDQSLLVATFVYERRPPHAVTAILDYNFHGLIRDCAVAADPAKIRQGWTEASRMPVRPLDEQALADALAHGIELYDMYLEPPVTEEGHQLMPLLRSRLRLLPEPRPIEEPEVPDEARAEVVDDFVASPEAAGLPEVGGGPATELARWLVDFACDYGAGDPLRWSPIAVEIVLADWLPRKAILEPAEVEVLPEVVRRFVRYAARRKGLADDVIAETLEAVDRFAPDFADGMADDEQAGPAKQLLLELRAAGIDPIDEAAVQRFIDARNAELAHGRGDARRSRRPTGNRRL